MRRISAILIAVLLVPLAVAAADLPLEVELPAPCSDNDFLVVGGTVSMVAEVGDGSVGLAIDPTGLTVTSDRGASFEAPAPFSVRFDGAAGDTVTLELHYPFAADDGAWMLNLRQELTLGDGGEVGGHVLSFSAECGAEDPASAEVVPD